MTDRSASAGEPPLQSQGREVPTGPVGELIVGDESWEFGLAGSYAEPFGPELPKGRHLLYFMAPHTGTPSGQSVPFEAARSAPSYEARPDEPTPASAEPVSVELRQRMGRE